MTDDLEAIFTRIRGWSPEWQEYAAGALRSIEHMIQLNGRKYLMTEDQMAELEAALIEDGVETAGAISSDTR